LALAAQPLLEIVDETPARAYVDMDMDAPLWGVGANEERYVDGGKSRD